MNVTDQGTLFKWALSGLGNKQTRVIDRLNSNSSTTSQPSADRRASLKSPSVVKRAKSKKTTAENAPEADSRAEGKQDVSRKSLPHAATFQNGVPLELDVGTNVFLSSSGNEQQTANSTNLLRTPPSTASGDLIDGTAVFLAPASLSPTHKRAQSDLSLFNEADDNGEQVPKSSAVRLLSQCSGNMSRSACCSDLKRMIRVFWVETT